MEFRRVCSHVKVHKNDGKKRVKTSHDVDDVCVCVCVFFSRFNFVCRFLFYIFVIIIIIVVVVVVVVVVVTAAAVPSSSSFNWRLSLVMWVCVCRLRYGRFKKSNWSQSHCVMNSSKHTASHRWNQTEEYDDRET